MSDLFERFRLAMSAATPLALATVIEAEDPAAVGAKLLVLAATGVATEFVGTLGNEALDRVVGRDAEGEIAAGRSGIRHYGPAGEARERAVAVFIEVFAPPPRMLVFGAVDFTAALVSVAKVLGFHVTVCDARAVFASPRRFPGADEVVVDWPDRLLDRVGATLGPRDAVCVLTHDHRFDVPAVLGALRTDVGYIGAMGSRRTTAARRERLVAAGVEAQDLARLRAPIGLDLGARTPEETAIAICAEIIALRCGHGARPLSDGTAAIHGDPTEAITETAP